MRDHQQRQPLVAGPMIVAVVAALIVLLGFTIPSPYVIERPGPVVNTLGTTVVDGETRPVVAVEGVDTYPTGGELNLLTLSTVGNPDRPVSWFALIPALVDHAQSLRPMQEVFREGLTPEERDEANRILMERSQGQATAAALQQLDITFATTVRVAGVAADAPADGILQTGDQFVAVDGIPVTSAAEIAQYVQERGAGSEISLEIIRGGQELTFVVVPAFLDGQDRAYIGVTLDADYEFPIEIDILLDRIGGPSAGMMFALAIYDLLTPGALVSDLTVSGTGTIDEDGDVGAIGGLPQKLWAAAEADTDLFLMPIGNCVDLPAEVPPGLLIAPVATLDEALFAIEAVADGSEVRGVEACDSVIAQGTPLG